MKLEMKKTTQVILIEIMQRNININRKILNSKINITEKQRRILNDNIRYATIALNVFFCTSEKDFGKIAKQVPIIT